MGVNVLDLNDDTLKVIFVLLGYRGIMVGLYKPNILVTLHVRLTSTVAVSHHLHTFLSNYCELHQLTNLHSSLINSAQSTIEMYRGIV